MKSLLESFGLGNPNTPTFEHIQRKTDYNDMDMEAFTKWCQELKVSSLARGSEFTVMIGNHLKIVTLDRF